MSMTADETYRTSFADRVLAGQPASILEVGSGSGRFLRSVKGRASRIAGADPSDATFVELRQEGFEMIAASANALPFADGAFDCVVFSFTSHHLADWSGAMREALRVARRCVHAMDGWYDLAFPDQRTSLAYENWCKTIDERLGMVHRPVLSSADLAAPGGGLRIDYAFRRVVEACNIDELRDDATIQLERIDNDIDAATRLAPIMRSILDTGATVEGVHQMTFWK